MSTGETIGLIARPLEDDVLAAAHEQDVVTPKTAVARRALQQERVALGVGRVHREEIDVPVQRLDEAGRLQIEIPPEHGGRFSPAPGTPGSRWCRRIRRSSR